MLTMVLEDEARAGNEIDDRPGHLDFAVTSKAGDPLGDVNGDPGYVVAPKLDLPDVDPCSDVQAKLAERIPDGESALDGSGRTVEGCKGAVAGALHQPSGKAQDLTFDHLVMLIKPLLPGPVAEQSGLLGRTNNVGEQHGG